MSEIKNILSEVSFSIKRSFKKLIAYFAKASTSSISQAQGLVLSQPPVSQIQSNRSVNNSDETVPHFEKSKYNIRLFDNVYYMVS